MKVIPITKRSQSHVLDRALKGSRPFKNKDLGYKDTLIWLSVVDNLAPNCRKVIFVSADQDFGSEGELYDDLKDDLVAKTLEPSHVQLITSLKQTIELLNSEFDAESALIKQDELDEGASSVAHEELGRLLATALAGRDFSDELVGILDSRSDLLERAQTPRPFHVFSAGEDIEFDVVSFTYAGDSVWSFEASGDWHVLVSYTDDSGWDQAAVLEQDIVLSIETTGYLDVENDILESIDFKVTNPDFWGMY